VLIHLRSPLPMRHWLIALLAVLDAAALQLALNPSMPQGEARLCLRAGFTCLRELARIERISFDADPAPEARIGLGYEEFGYGIVRMRSQGYPMERTPEQAWPHFRGWRVNYESIVYELAYRLDAVPALWSGPRRRGMVPMDVVTPVDRRPDVSDQPEPGNPS